MELTVLYRPVGQRQYELVEAMGFRRFLPRLPEQPFFYPVANEEYATQIAREWNGRDEGSGWTGHVFRFGFVLSSFAIILCGRLARPCIRSIGYPRTRWICSTDRWAYRADRLLPRGPGGQAGYQLNSFMPRR
jgi:hypothetical protein